METGKGIAAGFPASVTELCARTPVDPACRSSRCRSGPDRPRAQSWRAAMESIVLKKSAS